MTRRYETECNDDLYLIAKKLGINKDHIHFTNGDWKYELLDKLGVDLHYDDKGSEVMLIKLNTKIKTILVK